MTLRERYKHFKEWQIHAFDWSFDENERHHCVNCDNDFVGNYCPHCSQKSGLGKVTWKSVLQSTAEVWGMGNRSLLYSLWQLIWRPGYFISDYINGKRQVSFPPVKMLVVMGVISVLVDHLFVTPEVKIVEDGSPLVNQFFAWFEGSPGWGWLIMTCFFLIPTWCLFRYAPRNAKPTLPQCFFITVFMGIQVLIVDDLADLFNDYFYILLPLCYFYSYRQLFGYNFWGHFWRVTVVLFSGFMMAVSVMSIVEFFTIVPESSRLDEIKTIVQLLLLSVVPVLAGLYISKISYKRNSKKKKA